MTNQDIEREYWAAYTFYVICGDAEEKNAKTELDFWRNLWLQSYGYYDDYERTD